MTTKRNDDSTADNDEGKAIDLEDSKIPYRDDEEMENLTLPVDSPVRVHPRERYVEEVHVDTFGRQPSEHTKGVDRSPVSQKREVGGRGYVTSTVSTDSDRYYRAVRRAKVFRNKKKPSTRQPFSIKLER